MKNLQTFESFINEAKNAEKDKKKIIKQINDLIKKRNDREEAIDIVLLDGGYFPETDDDYFDFVQSIDSDILDEGYVNEAVNRYVLKPYQFRDAGIDAASLPVRGESKFCVIRHDVVIVNGIEVYLNNAIPGAGQGGMTVSVIGLYDTENDAKAAFKNEVKQKVGSAQLSVAMGNLFNKKFGLSFEEIEGYVAKGTVK